MLVSLGLTKMMAERLMRDFAARNGGPGDGQLRHGWRGRYQGHDRAARPGAELVAYLLARPLGRVHPAISSFSRALRRSASEPKKPGQFTAAPLSPGRRRRRLVVVSSHRRCGSGDGARHRARRRGALQQRRQRAGAGARMASRAGAPAPREAALAHAALARSDRRRRAHRGDDDRGARRQQREG